MAFPKAGTRGPQAVLTRRGDQRNHWRALIQSGQLSQIAGYGLARPVLHLGQHAGDATVLGLDIQACLLHAMQTQITGAPLQQGHANGQPQDLGQPRQVAREQLVLQGLGRGRQQHPLTTQQGGHQIGVGLAHTGTRLHHQRAPFCDGLSHRNGHLGLAVTRLKMLVCPRQHTTGGKHLGHHGHQRHQAGSWGSSCRSSRSMASRSTSRRFLRRRKVSSSGAASGVHRSMSASRSACSMRSSIN